MSRVTGTNGISHTGGLNRPPVHERFLALGVFPQTRPSQTWHTEGNGHCGMRNGNAPLVTSSFLGVGGANRCREDLFVSRHNVQCPLLFSIHDLEEPLGMDALAHVWPLFLLYVPSPGSHSVQGVGAPPQSDSNSFALASNALATSTPVRTAMAAPTMQGHAITDRGDSLSSTLRAPGTLGLAREWCNLSKVNE